MVLREWLRALARIVVVVCAFGAIAGCGDFDDDDEGSRESDETKAYKACQPSYNSEFRDLRGQKVMVAGVDDQGRYQCFWSSGYDDYQEARNSAMNRCQQRMSRCFIFATTQGVADWVQRVSDRQGGGVAGGGRPTSGGGGDRPPCNVDAEANYDQRQPAGTCSARNMSFAECQRVPGYRHYKRDHGSGFTECFWDR